MNIRHCLNIVLVSLSLAIALPAAADTPAFFKPPRAIVSDVAFQIDLAASDNDGALYSFSIVKNGETVFSNNGTLPAKITDVTLSDSGRYQILIEVGDDRWTHEVRVFPGFFSLLPPLLAILMALVFRQVVIALFAGIWLGAFFVNDYHVVRSFFYIVDHYVVDSMTGDGGSDHVSIAIFTLLLGGMVGVFSRVGGTQGIVNEISKFATTPRRAQLSTWLMGVCIFFDDYTNTLIVGNTMRALTDKLKISREKLSYIVDSTAAPIACIAVITSWIGFEISLLKDAFEAAGIDRNPFTTFVASIQYSFYPIITLVFGVVIAASTKDFGPMLKAERRARTTGNLLAANAVPLSNIDTDISFTGSKSPRWYNAAIPIFVVVIGTFVGLVITGRSSLIEAGTTSFSLMDTIHESNSFIALLWSSLAGSVVAVMLGVGQRLVSFSEAINAWTAGVKSMVAALIILVLAWGIGAVCTDLGTAGYLVAKLSGIISPAVLPTIIFLVAAAISFSTGTSWGTMTILTPITIPMVIKISEVSALTGGGFEAVLLSSIAAILAGSVFGDHCSPISDTTIMSSMASAADHVDHVRTQLPYALTVGLIAVLLGYLPAGFNVPSIVSLALGAAAAISIVMFFGKSEVSYNEGP